MQWSHCGSPGHPLPLSENGSIIGAIGVSGGTDSQDEIVSKAGPAANNQPISETNK
jgi:uncharacterized protein GlcG (DUF336 family)